MRLGLLGERGALKGDAAWAAGTWTGEVAPLSLDLLDGRPLVIDALFGAGLTRPIDGIAGQLIDRINREALTTVAVDVPSGLHGDSGEIMGRAPMAARTVTFFRAKPGHYSLEGLRRCGALEVADIGITPVVLHEIAPRLWLNAPALWQQHLQRTDRGDHKYARGHATILAGEIATGAARLAALGARRAGAGLVTIATPPAALAVYQSAEPGNLVTVCEDGDAFGRLLEDERRNAILVGPGSGVGERTRAATLAALATRRPVVLDADAITVFGQAPAELFAAIQGPALLTPHEGEFRRLFPDLTAIAGEGRARAPGGAPQRRHGTPEGARHRDRRARRARGHQRSCLAWPRHGRGGRRPCRHRRRPDGAGPVAVRGRCGGGLAPWRMRAALRLARASSPRISSGKFRLRCRPQQRRIDRVPGAG